MLKSLVVHMQCGNMPPAFGNWEGLLFQNKIHKDIPLCIWSLDFHTITDSKQSKRCSRNDLDVSGNSTDSFMAYKTLIES